MKVEPRCFTFNCFYKVGGQVSPMSSKHQVQLSVCVHVRADTCACQPQQPLLLGRDQESACCTWRLGEGSLPVRPQVWNQSTGDSFPLPGVAPTFQAQNSSPPPPDAFSQPSPCLLLKKVEDGEGYPNLPLLSPKTADIIPQQQLKGGGFKSRS